MIFLSLLPLIAFHLPRNFFPQARFFFILQVSSHQLLLFLTSSLSQVLFRHFGEHVRAWVTFNEPLSFCQEGYGGQDAPGKRASGVEDYMCAHTVLRAHGMVYRLYKEEFDRNNQGTYCLFSKIKPLFSFDHQRRSFKMPITYKYVFEKSHSAIIIPKLLD